MSQYYANEMDAGVGISQPSERAAFIRRTYVHLAGAILAFLGLEVYLFTSGIAASVMQVVVGLPWLVILGAFILCAWIGRSFASNVGSKPLQYFGLMFYIVAEAFLFIPLLYMALAQAQGTQMLSMAAGLTLSMFLGLTGIVFITRKDFSFLGSALTIGGFVAIGLIVCGALFGFNLGLVFSGFMVLLASGAILYDTSKVMNNYRTDQHVAASLELFASVALLFWYILRIFMGRR